MRVIYEQFAYRPVTPSRWTKGKSVPVRCWATGAPAEANFHPMTEAEWKALTVDQQMGLNYAEFSTIAPKWAEGASPVLRNNRLPGIVSIQAPSAVYQTLAGPVAQMALGIAIGTIRETLT